MDDVRRAFGESAVVIRSHVEQRGSRTVVEVVAAREDDLEILSHRLTPPAPVFPTRIEGQAEIRPLVIALVGPSGAGKTSTLVKLALNGRMFSTSRIALLTLDTFRVAALDQLQQYADIGGLRLEAIFDEREIAGAMRRLSGFDVVLVDTPGRTPRATDASRMWQSALQAVAPDETHLVLPVTLRPDATSTTLAHFAGCRPTHLLPTKTDEAVTDAGLIELIGRTDLPMRWIATGQSVPDDIEPAKARVLVALGLASPAARRAEANAA
jgi:flagellar biosynthesis protein FlhF